MRNIRILTYLALCLGLAYCSGEVNETQDLLTTNADTGSDVKASQTPIYIGKYSSLRYFHGGGYPQPNVPNYRVDLKLSVNSSGTIDGVLDTPECKASHQVDAMKYSKLLSAFESAKFQPVAVGNIIVDAPEKSITAIAGKEVKKYHLQHYNPLLTVETAGVIEEAAEDIASDLAESGCATDPGTEVKIVDVRFQNEITTKLKNGGKRTLSRAFKFENKGGKLIANGHATRRNSVTGRVCSKRLVNHVVDDSIVKALEKVEFSSSQPICLIAVAPGNSSVTRFYIAKSDGSKGGGTVGCWNERQALNTTEFTNKWYALLAKIPAKCSDLPVID